MVATPIELLFEKIMTEPAGIIVGFDNHLDKRPYARVIRSK